ncbi:MAG TPA: orotate phosphoribosyltransferase [Usitatibacter sp.]|jgi:orotate phosphoribosyltransferase|nr:orotate phosphoribosyltransferase [Usitatibacter sp.]HEX3097653.1 orotate phosphoribosyltransferase [Usitatibacter sp.]
MNAAPATVPAPDRDAFRREFVAFAIRAGVLRFGDFVTKAGRQSPYFFNAGLFSDGARLGELAGFFARAALASGIRFDVLFGPAYKGITLASATAVALAGLGHNVPFCFNRKEAKDHGEGGSIVGAPLAGRALIVDDVITDGASKREAIEIIRAAGAVPAGVLIALDRQERGQGPLSATQEVSRDFGVPVAAIATLEDILATLRGRPEEQANVERIEAYRRRYGIAAS